MKQHITLEQQNELTDEQHKKLLTWCLKQNWLNEEVVWGQHKGECRGGVNLHEYLLTIGQMIEFLEEEYNTAMASWKGWAIMIEQGRNINVHSYENNELCDALWEAVKDTL